MKRSSLVITILLAGLFALGLVRLFDLRFERGDIYPAYSSFRADPLGTKALYESLDTLLPASRHLQPWSKLGEGRGATLLYLGAEPESLVFSRDELRRLETFVAEGGRLVISLTTRYRKRPPPISPRRDENLEAAGNRWGFDFAYAALPKDAQGEYQHAPARATEDDAGFPAEFAWHTAVYFEKLGPEWKTIYAISNDLPVLIERPLGDGTIVLCSDPYPFSNEALLNDRQASLLTWMAGHASRVIFDETHLGIIEEPGLATLARRYRLHGLALALLVLAFLYIWKNAVPFVPAFATAETAEESVAGRESAAGFVNLLRRNIAPRELISVCIEEWKRSCGQRVGRARLERVQAVIDSENQLSPAKRDPLRIYREVSNALSTRRRPTS